MTWWNKREQAYELAIQAAVDKAAAQVANDPELQTTMDRFVWRLMESSELTARGKIYWVHKYQQRAKNL